MKQLIGDKDEEFLPDTKSGKLKWDHVPRKHNQQADLLTKGTLDLNYLESEEWLHGPKYISEKVNKWPVTVFEKGEINQSTPQDECKFKMHLCLLTHVNKDDNQMHKLAERLSCYTRLINTTAYYKNGEHMWAEINHL